ncbi:RDD family protein [Halomarina oriensis]|uniref:RDD family protein n=1 Tax=Halomarina oriensis TaxID=671145 RepID=A0A6B0GRI6_9EURY|nr:RDD family protein [Halomarina oriensis]MWG34735.1 RDD family protein [Halomarina oriensis]
MPSSNATATGPRRCGLGIRGVAIAIDSFVWFTLLFVAIFPIAAVTGDITTTGGTTNADLEGTASLVGVSLWVALGLSYHTLAEWRFGRTVGKHLVAIRVRNADGSPLTLRSSLVRNVVRLVDFLPVSYVVGIVAFAVSDRRRLGDRLADTVVVRV